MADLSELDFIDLQILQAISNTPGIRTAQIASSLQISGSQVLRRTAQLASQEWVIKQNGVPGQVYQHHLGSATTPDEVAAEIRR